MSASGALQVKVVLAIALRADVLIKRSAPFAAMKFTQNFYVAKLCEVAIKTAFARLGLLADLLIELVYGKLAVGIATKEADKRFPTRRFLSFSHLFSP